MSHKRQKPRTPRRGNTKGVTCSCEAEEIQSIKTSGSVAGSHHTQDKPNWRREARSDLLNFRGRGDKTDRGNFAKLRELLSTKVMLTTGIMRTVSLPTISTFGTFRTENNASLRHVAIGRGIKLHIAAAVVRSQSLSFKEGYVPSLVRKRKTFPKLAKTWRTVDPSGRCERQRMLLTMRCIFIRC